MGDKFAQHLDQMITWAIATVLGGVVGGISWLVRRVFTNHKQIEMLQRDLAAREKQRDEDRAQVADIKRSVDRIEGWIVTGKAPVQHHIDKTIPPR